MTTTMRIIQELYYKVSTLNSINVCVYKTSKTHKFGCFIKKEYNTIQVFVYKSRLSVCGKNIFAGQKRIVYCVLLLENGNEIHDIDGVHFKGFGFNFVET